MEKNEITAALAEIVGRDALLTDELMSKHTTFHIGGPADWFVSPASEEEVQKLLSFLKREEIPYYVIGNGSNLLVSDKGYRGVILSVFRRFQGVSIEGNVIEAKAGTLLSTVSHSAQAAGLSGLAFASGIPGTIGGAVMMNAGAYGGEMKDVITSVRVVDSEGEIRTIPASEMEFGYRTSAALKNNYTVLSARMELTPGDAEEILAVMQDLRSKRIEKQPLEFPSAGSTFKRPTGYFAGKLIQDAGLRGFTVGGAQVSEKHCGFVINRGNATCEDVRELMKQVSDRVEAQFGVPLEPEVRFLGEL